MAFADELAKLQRQLRVHARFSTDDNPDVTAIGDRRYGRVYDNTAAVPIKGTVTRFGTFSRALTNYDQAFEIPSVSIELIDKANEWRQLASRPWQLVNRWMFFTLRVLSDDGTVSTDADIAYGLVTEPRFPPVGKVNLGITASPGEYLGERTPRRIVTLEDFPNADPSAIGQPVPYIYGVLDSLVQGVITGFTGTVIPPSGHPGVTLDSGTAVPGGSGDYTEGGFYYAAAVEIGGVRVSPLSNTIGPFYADATNNAISIAFTNLGGAYDNLRIFRSTSPGFGQYDGADHAGASPFVDTHPGIVDMGSDWTLEYRWQVYYYLSAIVDGEELPAVGPLMFGLNPDNFSTKKIQLTWNAPVVADSLILRRAYQEYHFPLGMNRQWSISAASGSFLDELNDTSAVTTATELGTVAGGALVLLKVNTNPDAVAGQYDYLVSGHGCKFVREVYRMVSAVEGAAPAPVLQTYGVDYTLAVVTVNGNSYQLVRFTADPGTDEISANVDGIEESATATGINDGTDLILSGPKAMRHWFLNWVFNSYTSGSWFTDTGLRSGLLDLDSFDDAHDVAVARVAPSGYIVGGAQVEEIEIRQAIQEWLASFDLDLAYTIDGQYKASMFTPAIGDRSAMSHYTPKDGIFREGFECWIDVQRMANQIPWQAGRIAEGYALSGTENALAEQAADRYGRIITAPLYTLPWTSDASTAVDVVRHRLTLVKNPPVMARFPVPLRAINDELGDLVLGTHPRGIAGVATGWRRRALKILRSELDLDALVVWLTVQDIDALMSFLGYVLYGDADWDASDLTYVTALAGKQDIYGYLADRTTGLLSDGSAAKKFGSR